MIESLSVMAATLNQLAGDPKHLGAQIGFTAILHTWGQNLEFHPHLHCVVTGGGLSPDGKEWIATRDNFLMSVKVVAKLFKGKFLHELAKARKMRQLKFVGKANHLQDTHAWRDFMDVLYAKDWVVYAEPPFGGPEHVFKYLGRYTHRVAISNHRLVSFENGKVTFEYKDYADNNRKKRLTLDSVEFIRRFLLHVLPGNLVRIRHYGICAGCNVNTKLQAAKQILEPQPKSQSVETPNLSGLPWWEKLQLLTGVDIMACPHCKQGRFNPASIPISDIPNTDYFSPDTS